MFPSLRKFPRDSGRAIQGDAADASVVKAALPVSHPLQNKLCAQLSLKILALNSS